MENTKFTLRETQAAIDIALTAGEMLAAATIETEDSRELVDWIASAARRFEAEFGCGLISGNASELDYTQAIEHFAVNELQARFPRVELEIEYEESTGTYSG